MPGDRPARRKFFGNPDLNETSHTSTLSRFVSSLMASSFCHGTWPSTSSPAVPTYRLSRNPTQGVILLRVRETAVFHGGIAVAPLKLDGIGFRFRGRGRSSTAASPWPH